MVRSQSSDFTWETLCPDGFWANKDKSDLVRKDVRDSQDTQAITLPWIDGRKREESETLIDIISWDILSTFGVQKIK